MNIPAIERSLATASLISAALGGAAATIAEPSQNVINGELALIGVLAGAVLVIFAAAIKLFDTRWNEKARLEFGDDAKPFRQHLADAKAHGAMREAMTEQFQAELREIGKKIESADQRHHETLQMLLATVQPIVAQNADALKFARAQARRQADTIEE